VLTAGHDAAKLQGSISIDVSREGDQIIQMNGSTKAIRTGDMVMRDAKGVCCSFFMDKIIGLRFPQRPLAPCMWLNAPVGVQPRR